jgi:hypothetical protein
VNKTFQFSIWRVGQKSGAWIGNRIQAESASEALHKEIKGSSRKFYIPGLYFVCDPGKNPDSGWYGPTLFWIEEDESFFPVEASLALKEKGQVEVTEVIEI